MANKMIIDASHPEETRVVVLRGNRVEEFDFESASKRQLRGNIYLAKVTRVEPSLQAAFIEYGGNRHGFLAFSEIHPDYYQIPVADRQALLEDEARRLAEEEDDGENQKQRRSRRNRDGRGERAHKRHAPTGDSIAAEAPSSETEHELARAEEMDAAWSDHADQQSAGAVLPGVPHEADSEAADSRPEGRHGARGGRHGEDNELSGAAGSFGHIEEVQHDHGGSDEITTLGGDEDGDDEDLTDEIDIDERGGHAPAEDSESDGDAAGAHSDERAARGHSQDEDDDQEAPAYRAPRHRRQYKIQEVIKRRQVLLVQVVKEERGNKGAALTTYLSLAGRYSVLMPNTARGGGISRKITNNVDRKRLKEIAQELEVPDGMGIILRTAGAARGKAEVKRDFEYLLRMWEQVRELTLKSSAPMLTYEEGSLIKRAIRDLYSKEIDEVIVAGEAGYREAKDFMRMLMPGHSKNVIAYRDPQPIFARAGVDSQLDAMFAAQVTLKSGGYIVINQTEALVAIDVNSGRSTREHNIEDTAVRTNLEAADEIARQLRLRDLAGLIVIDFIDMEEHRNNRSVERRIKDALRNDRARIQIGRISHFGLLEMSRQRIRTGVLEGSTVMCAHCMGAGTVRSTASIALHVLRVVEDTLTRSAAYNLTVRSRSTVALYILNQKRSHLRELERRFGVTITIDTDDTLTGVAYHAIERGDPATPVEDALPLPANFVEEYEPDDEIVDEVEVEEAVSDDMEEDQQAGDATEERSGRSARRAASQDQGDESEEAQAEKGRRRRRRRRGGRNGERESSDIAANAPQPPDDALGAISEIAGAQIAAVPEEEAGAAPDEAAAGRQRNRRARGGRGRNRNPRDVATEAADGIVAEDAGTAHLHDRMRDTDESHLPEAAAAAVPEPEHAPPSLQPKAVFWPAEAAVIPIDLREAYMAAEVSAVAVVDSAAPALPVTSVAAIVADKPAPVSTELDPTQPKKSGWWKRAPASFGG